VHLDTQTQTITRECIKLIEEALGFSDPSSEQSSQDEAISKSRWLPSVHRLKELKQNARTD